MRDPFLEVICICIVFSEMELKIWKSLVFGTFFGPSQRSLVCHRFFFNIGNLPSNILIIIRFACNFSPIYFILIILTLLSLFIQKLIMLEIPPTNIYFIVFTGMVSNMLLWRFPTLFFELWAPFLRKLQKSTNDLQKWIQLGKINYSLYLKPKLPEI